MASLLPQVTNKAGLEYVFNGIVDAMVPAARGGRNGMAAAASRFPVFGGATLNGEAALNNAGGKIAIEGGYDVKPSVYPFYVFEDEVGRLDRGPTVPAGATPLYLLTSATFWTDYRGGHRSFFGSKVIVPIADAASTLTAQQLLADQIRVTGSLTADRQLTFGGYGSWLVTNNTGGGKNLVLDGAVSVPPGTTFVYARCNTALGVQRFHACSNYNSPGTFFVQLTDTSPTFQELGLLGVNGTANGLAVRTGRVWVPTVLTATTTVASTDGGKHWRSVSTSAFNMTLGTAPAIGTRIRVSRFGTGAITFVAGSGATLIKRAAVLTIASTGTVHAEKVSATTWQLRGDLG